MQRVYVDTTTLIVSWIGLSLLISLPLLYTPDSLIIYVKTPYIALWIGVLSHSMIYKKLIQHNNSLRKFITLPSALLFVLIWILDSVALSALIWVIRHFGINKGPQYFILVGLP